MHLAWQRRVSGFLALAVLIVNGRGSLVFGDVIPARKIMMLGEAAPGITNATYNMLWDISINDAGQTAFWAGTSQGPAGIWSDPSGAVALVAREGVPAAGAQIGTIIHTPLLSNLGRIIFQGSMTAGGQNFGIWGGDGSGLSKVAFTNTSADVPGVTTNITFIGKSGASYFGGPAANAVGSAAFFASLSGTVSGLAIMKHVPGVGMSIVARNSTLAPGTTGSFLAFGRAPETLIPTLNDNNEVAFYATTIAPAGRGIWAERSGSLQLVARNATVAPGTTDNFSDFRDPRLNNAGKVAFAASLTSATTNNTGIWSEGSGTLALVAREGSQAAGFGAGVLYGELVNAPLLLHDGHVAFSGPITGAGIDANHNTALWMETAAGLQLVAQEGTQIPGAAPGVEFGEFGILPEYFALGASNSAGILAFNATLRGPGITANNDGSIWTYSPSGQLQRVIMAGDSIEIQPGDVRVVRDVFGALGGGGENGGARGFNNSNELAFQAFFTNGTSGFFVTAPQGASGDMNCDGVLNLLDVNAMTLALTDPAGYAAAYPGCPLLNGDYSSDSTLDGRDIAGFVVALTGP